MNSDISLPPLKYIIQFGPIIQNYLRYHFAPLVQHPIWTIYSQLSQISLCPIKIHHPIWTIYSQLITTSHKLTRCIEIDNYLVLLI